MNVRSPMAVLLLAGYNEVKDQVWGDVDELARHEQALDSYLRSLGPVYEARKELRGRIAELRGPIKLPRVSRQTDKQRRVSACPRCGTIGADVGK